MMYLAFPIILIIWAGMIVGLSFIATPIKFHAAHITLPIALEIGKATFHTFNIIEWGVLFVAFAVSWAKEYPLIRVLFFLCIITILSLQVFWLQPIMDERVRFVIAGNTLLKTPHHLIYIFLEILKFFLLLAMGYHVLLTLIGERDVT